MTMSDIGWQSQHLLEDDLWLLELRLGHEEVTDELQRLAWSETIELLLEAAPLEHIVVE